MAEKPVIKEKALDRSDALAAAIIFAAAMVLYVRTLAPTLLLGDSGEYQVLAYTLGLAHPTGYSIFVLLLKLITLLVPVKDIAYRVNLASAIFAALTLSLLYLLGKLLGGRRLAALLGVTALGLYHLFWWHAVIAESYTVATALLALELLLVVAWRKTKNAWLLFGAGLAGGLGLGIHTFVLLAAPAVLVYLACKARRFKDWGLAALGALAGVALAVGSFFALNARGVPSSFLEQIAPQAAAWGMTAQQFSSPVNRMIYLMGGKQFQDQMFVNSIDKMTHKADEYYRAAQHDLPTLMLWLAGLGLLLLFFYKRPGERRRWPEALLLLLSAAAMLVFIVNYNIGDIYTYYMISYIPPLAAAATGAAGLLDLLAWGIGKLIPSPVSNERIPASASSSSISGEQIPASSSVSLVSHPWRTRRGGAEGAGGWRSSTRPLAFWLSGMAGAALVAALLWVVVAPSAKTVDLSWRMHRITFLDGTDFADYPYPVTHPDWPHSQAEAIVAQVENDAILFTDWGILYPVFYVAQVEDRRPGILAHEQYPAGSDGKLTPTAIDYIQANFGKHPIYFTQVDDDLAQNYNFVEVDPSIPLYRLEKR